MLWLFQRGKTYCNVMDPDQCLPHSVLHYAAPLERREGKQTNKYCSYSNPGDTCCIWMREPTCASISHSDTEEEIHQKKKSVHLVKEEDEWRSSWEQEEEAEPEIIIWSLSLCDLWDIKKISATIQASILLLGCCNAGIMGSGVWNKREEKSSSWNPCLGKGALTRWLGKKHKSSASVGNFFQMWRKGTPSRKMLHVTQVSGTPWRKLSIIWGN